ncbi:MAG: hypothetical protein H7X99_05315 [Saprospiraceae bacterium]|nr:hypothetical protein [Saprospiraceae bacterium]
MFNLKKNTEELPKKYKGVVKNPVDEQKINERKDSITILDIPEVQEVKEKLPETDPK